VAVADINGDGHPDLAVANSGSGKVTVLIGSGTGHFRRPSAYLVGSYPFSPQVVVAGDFNGDGHADLAVSLDPAGAEQIDVLMNTGNGAFLPKVPYQIGSSAKDLIAADLNGDGVLDLAAPDASGYAGAARTLLGNGDGTFRVGGAYLTIRPATAVAAADFNGDGIADLAVTSAPAPGPSLTVLIGTGGGTFAGSPNYNVGPPISVAHGDFNSDGIMDAVVADSGGSGSASVLLGTGDGKFQFAQSYAVNDHPTSVAVGDLNGDGVLDLAVSTWGGSAVCVLLGNGDGTFQPKVSYSVGKDPETVTVTDLNGDGHLDLVTANLYGASISVLLGNGDGTFKPGVAYAAGNSPWTVAAGDFNSDGHPDIAVGNQDASGTLWVFLGAGDGSLQSPLKYDGGELPTDIAVADFNGDGALDLGVCDDVSTGNSVAVLLGRGDGTFRTPAFYAAGVAAFGIAAGDFNGDGALDLVTANNGFSNGTGYGVGLLLGNADGTFQAAQQFYGGPYPVDVTAADFTGDGRVDAAVANNYGATVTLLVNDGSWPAPPGGGGPYVGSGALAREDTASLTAMWQAGTPAVAERDPPAEDGVVPVTPVSAGTAAAARLDSRLRAVPHVHWAKGAHLAAALLGVPLERSSGGLLIEKVLA
jgi:hypothetical protein